tara:strand:- start:550 stop:849 length:300 start_codon:yes stop_codon:yes gene_type:complete
MAKRYDYTKIIKNKHGERVYKTTMYPTIEKHNDDIYVMSKDGERLDNLAYKYYKNESLWWIIAQANHIGKGSFNIKPGIQLRIPTNVSEIISEFEKMNK